MLSQRRIHHRSTPGWFVGSSKDAIKHQTKEIDDVTPPGLEYLFSIGNRRIPIDKRNKQQQRGW